MEKGRWGRVSGHRGCLGGSRSLGSPKDQGVLPSQKHWACYPRRAADPLNHPVELIFAASPKFEFGIRLLLTILHCSRRGGWFLTAMAHFTDMDMMEPQDGSGRCQGQVGFLGNCPFPKPCRETLRLVQSTILRHPALKLSPGKLTCQVVCPKVNTLHST